MSSSISFIIPAFNAEKTLSQCLAAVMTLAKVDDEVIVVDDASSDKTAAIAAQYPCKLISLLFNQGPGCARNQGAILASKEIFVFIDSDVLISKDDVDKLRRYFIENAEVHTLTMNVDKSDRSLNFYSDFKNLYMNYIISTGETSVNYVYGSFCATRKSDYIKWPEDIRLTEDSLWGFQQKRAGLTIHCLKDVQSTHLKNYSMKSLIINDFKISSYFAHSFLAFSRWKTLYTNESFGHTSKVQKISAILAGFIFPVLPVNYLISIFSILVIILLNGHFLFFVKKNRSLVFTIKSIFWYIFTYHVYLIGIMSGSISYCMQKNKFSEREIA